MPGRSFILLLCFLAAAVCPLPAACAVDRVTIQQGETKKTLAGRIEVEAADGGVLLLTPDGALWPIPQEEIVARQSDDEPFEPLAREELAAQLLGELPAGFKVHQTKNYLIAYNTSPEYAQWVGSLYERLFAAFYNYWERRGMTLHPPVFPLVALVFDSKDSYALHARAEVGDAARSMIGYYSLKTNRMISYDLTGGAAGMAKIQQILSQPGAERTVATIVHEATHQMAFNSGLQTRYADIPFWVSEGVAIYFETPDLKSAKGWRNIGGVNRVNLLNFRKYLRSRPAGLESLLSDDQRFRDPATATDAYAEAWALTYFLMRTRSADYHKYLRMLAEKKPLVELTAEQRIAEFQNCFGSDLAKLETEFLRYMQTVR
jgi:hypothetical protein